MVNQLINIELNGLNQLINNAGDALGQLAAINQELIRRQQRFTSRDQGAGPDPQRRAAALHRSHCREIPTLPGQQPASKEQAQELILQFKELDRTARRDLPLSTSWNPRPFATARAGPPDRPLGADLHSHNARPACGAKQKRIVALGLLGGLVLCGAALVRDRRSGLVFSDDELRTSCRARCWNAYYCGKPRTGPWPELLAQGPLKQAQTIALIPVGQPDTRGLQALWPS